MLSKDKIADQFKEHLKLSKRGLGDQYDNFVRCDGAYNGEINVNNGPQLLTGRTNQIRNTLVRFNKIKPYVSAIKGFMAQNRRKPQYTARIEDNEEQENKSEYFNALSSCVRDQANADQIETQQDGDMLIKGVGAIETNLTYGEGFSSRNPNGEVSMMTLDMMNVGWDSSARAANLLDSRFVHYKMEYDRQEAYDLFDDNNPQDFETVDEDNAVGMPIPGTGGGSYSLLREIYDVVDSAKDRVMVYFYQWFEIEKYYRTKNPLTLVTDPGLLIIMQQKMQAIAEEQEYPDDPFAFDPSQEVISCDGDTKKALIKAFDGIDIEFTTHKRRCYYTSVLSGKKVFAGYKSASQQGFTIKFKTGDWNETRKIWVGIVDQMIEPWLYYNKGLTELMFAIASGAKGGVMYEDSAVDDVAKFEQSYARTDSATKVNDGAISGNKIKPKREAYQPNGVEELIQIANDAIPDSAGIDKTFLGSSENKAETAALQRQRIKQVTAPLACYFDSITLYQREWARLFIDLMRIFVENNDGTIFKVMDQETGKTAYARISASYIAPEYDIEIGEGPDGASEREENLAMLSSLGDSLLQVDPATAKQVYAIGVKYTSFDMVDKQTLRNALVPEQGNVDPNYVKQLEQELQKLQSEGTQTQLKEIQTKSAVNLAKVEEINASVRNKNMDSIKKHADTDKVVEETKVIKKNEGEATVTV